MTVREFNGTSDELVTGVGAASGMVYGTAAALIKFSTLSGFHYFCMVHNASNGWVSEPIGLTNFGAWEVNYQSGAANWGTSGPSPSVGPWLLVVARKATGSAVPRLSMYNYTTGTWAHHDGSGPAGDGVAPGAGGQVRFSFQGSSDFFGGRVAARALWSNSLPWASDTTGDAAIEAAGLKDAAANWATANPSAFWLFDQATTATPVADLSTAGTADQTSVTGTTVITGDDPPGFDFSLGTPPETHSGSLALTGSGTLTAAGKPAAQGGTALTGSGGLAPTGEPSATGQVAFTGAGALTAAGSPGVAARLALSGAGTLRLASPSSGGPAHEPMLTATNTPSAVLAATNAPSSRLEATHGV
ncbi:MAG TPA: hypothetical protein VGH54_09540 [Mycobacterium sp.]|jgi:hypothetical protein|uniref:hypothetical protein n=1 Tax=Mycobacterium sp. TaxID=1785 RepID=UPI002F414F43